MGWFNEKQMARTLTPKRKGFVKDYKKTGIGTVAVINNFDVKDPKTAAVMASQLLEDPKIKAAIADSIPDDLLSEKHLALLNKVTEDGEIDVQAVSKGLDLAYKIKGTYAPEEHINKNLNMNMNTELDELIAQQTALALKEKKT